MSKPDKRTFDPAKIDALLEIMARLRDDRLGCPWDRAQTFESIVPHTLEEAYEVADVIERGAFEELPDELGDLLFQVVFYARLAEEAELFDFEAVVTALADKLVRRHPHVFADAPVDDLTEVQKRWEDVKQLEREQAAELGGQQGIGLPGTLAGVAQGLPALSRAAKIQHRAARVGFDWPEISPVLGKVREELLELEVEIGQLDQNNSDAALRSRLEAEFGDLLFACVNVGRHLGLDSEAALRRATTKFERRFEYVEAELAKDRRSARDADMQELDVLWESAKERE